jgi:glycerate 2-kinase
MTLRQTLTDYVLLAIAAAGAAPTLPGRLPRGAPKGRTIVLGCGKAAAEMARVARGALAGKVCGCVVTRLGHGVDQPITGIEVIEARHPVPDAAGQFAAERILTLAAQAGPDDRVIFLISGGGSALLCAPAAGLTLADKQAMTDHLVRSGAPIEHINLVRRHLSRVKGGRLAALAGARGAELYTFLISDVVDDDPALVASGPSIAAAFDPEAAIALLVRYGWDCSAAVQAAIRANHPAPARPHPVITVATNSHALAALHRRAAADGWNVIALGGSLRGEARTTGGEHAAAARDLIGRPGRHLLISGGELIVTAASAYGCGGPNLEYLAGVLTGLAPSDPIAVFAADSDGIDGTEDNAGGYAEAGAALPEALAKALAANRTYALFDALGALVKTGPTRTNVNDIRIIAVNGLA